MLGPIGLAVFTVMYDRTRDRANVEAMISAGTLDIEAVRNTLQTMLADDDERFARLAEAARRAAR